MNIFTLLNSYHEIPPKIIAIVIVVFWLLFTLYYLRFVPSKNKQIYTLTDEELDKVRNEITKRLWKVIFGLILSFIAFFFPFHPFLDNILPKDPQVMSIIHTFFVLFFLYYFVLILYDAIVPWKGVQMNKKKNAKHTN